MAFKPIGRLLIIDKGGTNFVECILDNERVELGRRPDCHITINSRSVSRTSVVFEYNQDTNSTWVTSVGSNLVTVDKQEMQRHQQVELKPGAVIEVQVGDHARAMVYQLMDETMVLPECCEGLLDQTIPLPTVEDNVVASSAVPAPPPPPPALPALSKAPRTVVPKATNKAPVQTGFVADPTELQRMRQGLRPLAVASPKAAPSPRAAAKRKSVRFNTPVHGTPEGVGDATMALHAHAAGTPAVHVAADSTMAFAEWAMGTHAVDNTTPASGRRQSVHTRTSTPAVARNSPRIMIAAKSSPKPSSPATMLPNATSATPNTMPLASAGGTAARSTRGKSRLANTSRGEEVTSNVEDTVQATLDVAMMAAARICQVVDDAEQTGQLDVADMQAIQVMVQRAVEAATQAASHTPVATEPVADGVMEGLIDADDVDMMLDADDAWEDAELEGSDDNEEERGLDAAIQLATQDALEETLKAVIAQERRTSGILHDPEVEEEEGAMMDEGAPGDVQNDDVDDKGVDAAFDTSTVALRDAWEKHFGDGRVPGDVGTAVEAANDVYTKASGIMQAGAGYRARVRYLKKRMQRLASSNKSLREQNKRLKLELMAANALLQSVDLDDATGSDYQPSPQPASEDDEVPAGEPMQATPHSASRLAIIRHGRPLGASPASVAPGVCSTQHDAPPTQPASTAKGPASSQLAPGSVTRSSTKVPVGTTPVRRRSLLMSHIYEALQQSAIKCGLTPKDSRAVVDRLQDEVEATKQATDSDSDTDCEACEGVAAAEDVCITCHRVEGGEIVLMCDGCNAVQHLHCGGYGKVPKGMWFCPPCAALPEEERTRLAAQLAAALSAKPKPAPKKARAKPAAAEPRKGRSARVAAKATAKAAAAEEEVPNRKRRAAPKVDAELPAAPKRTRRGASAEAEKEASAGTAAIVADAAGKAPSHKRRAAKENAEPTRPANSKRPRRAASVDKEALVEATNQAPGRQGRKAAAEAQGRATRRSTRSQR